MQFLVKLAVAVGIITLCSQIGGRFPRLAGLIATMPLTGLLVLIWLYSENPIEMNTLAQYTRGALWGIGPSILFFLAVWLCLHYGIGMALALTLGALSWLGGAIVHRLLVQ